MSFDDNNNGFGNDNHNKFDDYANELRNEKRVIKDDYTDERKDENGNIYRDPTVDEVTEDKIRGTKSVHEKEVITLDEEEIKRAKRQFSPKGVTNNYPGEIKTTGSLLNYKVELGPDGLPIRQENEDGTFSDKLLMKDNDYVIDRQVKWDENVEYDIRQGLVKYDTRASGKNQRNSFRDSDILQDAPMNHLLEQILEDINNAEDINDALIVQYPHFGLVRFSQGPNNWRNQRLLYKSSVDPLITLVKAKAGMKIRVEDSRRPQIKGKIVYKNVNYRVATGATQYGMFIVLRRQGVTFNSLDQLDLPPKIKSDFRRAVAGKDGLTIVGGPVGSGKTTLMTTSLIERLQDTDGSSNIISLEKPIETPTPGIIQEEIDEDYGMDWSTGIESALREMPTILRVGEVNEKPAAKAIVRGANSGIVALTTMHIRSVLEVFETLKDYDVAENEIKNALRLVIYLNRVPKLCPHCRKIKSTLSNADVSKWIDNNLNDGRPGTLGEFAERNPEGCSVCRQNQTDKRLYGTLGKVGIFELLRINKPLLMIWRRYQNEDIYVLKDKLLHPDTIRLINRDATSDKDKYIKVDDNMLSGLDYHPIEEDILAKMKSKDIDAETAKYLLNQ